MNQEQTCQVAGITAVVEAMSARASIIQYVLSLNFGVRVSKFSFWSPDPLFDMVIANNSEGHYFRLFFLILA